MQRGKSNWTLLALVFFCAFSVFCFVQNTSAATRSDVENFVTRFYWECLGRAPDAKGLQDWTNGLIDGVHTGDDVARHFTESIEFKGKNYSNDQYLEILYGAFFNRGPDPTGWALYISRLNAGEPRSSILDEFLKSNEFYDLCWQYGIFPHSVAAFVYRFYDECLGREPDRKGLEDWTKGLQEGVHTGADVARYFTESIEFKGKNYSNDQYLKILYAAFFNRGPDSIGWALYISRLNAGEPRSSILDEFLKSNEFIALCAEYGINPGLQDCPNVAGTWQLTIVWDLSVCGLNWGSETVTYNILQEGCTIIVDGERYPLIGNQISWSETYTDEDGTLEGVEKLFFSGNTLSGSIAGTFIRKDGFACFVTAQISGRRI